MEYVGLLGGLLCSLGGVPQLYKMMKTKRAGDLSWGMLCLWICGLSLNITYGISTRQYSIYIPSSCSFTISVMLSIGKFYYSHTINEYECIEHSQNVR